MKEKKVKMIDNKNLYRLSDLNDYQVAKNEPDVRGWTLTDGNEERVGYVNELIVDIEQEIVRYLDVVLDDPNMAEVNEPSHLLIPIGLAKLLEDKDEVMIERFTKEKLIKCPKFSGKEVTRAYEHDLITDLEPRPGKVARNPDDFYTYDYFNIDQFYERRRDRAEVVRKK